MKIASLFVLVLALPIAAFADAPGEAELTACIGGNQSWVPQVFSRLEPKMSPADAAAVLPGADQVSKFGFVTVKPAGCAVAAEYELYFAKNKKTGAFELGKATIRFDTKISADPAFYASLVKVATSKYGKVKKPEDVTRKLVTWANKKFKIAQLSAKPTRAGEMLQLSVSL